MKIYTIYRSSSNVLSPHSTYESHVIVANRRKEVRQLAINVSASEGKACWALAKITCIGKYTKTAKMPFILMSDFNGG